MIQRGFTVVEIIITITIMGILLLLAVVNLNASQMSNRDAERVSDVESIANNLESFHTSGVNSSNNIPRITNVVINPNFEIDTSTWYTPNGTISRTTTSSYSGSAALKFDTTAVGQVFYLTSFIPSSQARTYTASIMIKGSGTAVFALSTQPSTNQIANSGNVTLTSNWQQIKITGTTPTGATSVYPVIYQQASGTQTAYIDAVMITESTVNYSYADGSYVGWSWTGSANNSTSAGPAILLNWPGTYPSVSLTSSPLIKAYLSDADLKTFTAPGQSDPYTTFVPATNSIQTTAGVLPQPTKDQYVYQPIDSSGALCHNYDCRKYNLYYRLEKDNTVYKVASKNR